MTETTGRGYGGYESERRVTWWATWCASVGGESRAKGQPSFNAACNRSHAQGGSIPTRPAMPSPNGKFDFCLLTFALPVRVRPRQNVYRKPTCIDRGSSATTDLRKSLLRRFPIGLSKLTRLVAL